MKKTEKTILLLFPVISLAACGGGASSVSLSSLSYSSIGSSSSISQVSSASSQMSSSTEVSSSIISVSSSESSSVSSEPVELTMTLSVDKTPETDGSYRLKTGEKLTILPVFNDPDRAESVTYAATEKGIFGTSASTHVSVDNGVVTALGKTSNTITVTVTSESGLQDSILLTVYAELDLYRDAMTSKLDAALINEKNSASGGTYSTNIVSGTSVSESTTSFSVYSNNSWDAVQRNGTEETYIYSGTYRNVYYYYTKNAETGGHTAKRQDATPSGADILFQVKLNSMTSFYGISALAKYILTDANYAFGESAVNASSVTYEAETYTVTSSFDTNTFGTMSHTEIELKLQFESETGNLLSVAYQKAVYSSAEYDFEKKEITGNSSSDFRINAELLYQERGAASETFSPQDLYFTDFDIVIADASDHQSGTSFEVDTILEYGYGATLPETGDASIDRLTFESSSDPSVIDTNEDQQLVCLKEGISTLTFVSEGGVRKSVDITVTFSGIQGIRLNQTVTNLSKIKIGETITGLDAQVYPTYPAQAYRLYISEGEECVEFEKQEDGTYTLKAIAAGEAEITAETVYEDQTFAAKHRIQIYEPMSDEQIRSKLMEHRWIYSSTDWSGNTTTSVLSFTESEGTFSLKGIAEMTFDYTVSDGEILLSDVASTSSTYSLIKIVKDDLFSALTVTYKENSLFGTYNYDMTLKPETM